VFLKFNGNVPYFSSDGPRLLLLRFGHKPLKTRDHKLSQYKGKNGKTHNRTISQTSKNYTPALININRSTLVSSPFRCSLHSLISDQIDLRRLTNIPTIDPHHPMALVPHFPLVTRGGNLLALLVFLTIK